MCPTGCQGSSHPGNWSLRSFVCRRRDCRHRVEQPAHTVEHSALAAPTCEHLPASGRFQPLQASSHIQPRLFVRVGRRVMALRAHPLACPYPPAPRQSCGAVAQGVFQESCSKRWLRLLSPSLSLWQTDSAGQSLFERRNHLRWALLVGLYNMPVVLFNTASKSA